MSSLLDRLDASLLSVVARYLTVNEKLVRLLTLSTTTTRSLTPSCFGNDRVVLENAAIEYVALHGLSSSTVRLLSLASVTCVAKPWSTSLLSSIFATLKQFVCVKDMTLYIVDQSLRGAHLMALLQSTALHSLHSLAITVSTVSDDNGSANDSEIDSDNDSDDDAEAAEAGDDVTPTLNFATLRYPSLRSFAAEFLFGIQHARGQLPFLAMHSALTDLSVEIDFASEMQWKELLVDSRMFPQLRTLRLTGSRFQEARASVLLKALASTIIPATGQPRPLEHLVLPLNEQLPALALLPQLPTLSHTEISTVSKEWPDDIGSLPLSAVQSLMSFEYRYTDVDMQPVGQHQFQSLFTIMSAAPLTALKLALPAGVRLDDNVVASLARLGHLTRLQLIVPSVSQEPIDWSSPVTLAPLQCQCFALLDTLTLSGFTLSAESLAVLAAATPAMKQLSHTGTSGCHAAFVSLIAGHYWPRIEALTIVDDDILAGGRYEHHHPWPPLTMDQFSAAKQMFPQHPCAFHQLHSLDFDVCDCTTPVIWLHFLSLFRGAKRIDHVANITVTDVVSVMALSLLPSLRAIAYTCLLPADILSLYTDGSEDGTTYTEVRHGCSAETFVPFTQAKACDQWEYAQRRLVLRAKLDAKEDDDDTFDVAPYQFITEPVSNHSDGRAAFFDAVCQSLSVSDRQLTDAVRA